MTLPTPGPATRSLDTLASALYRAYVEWCAPRGEAPVSQAMFKARLEERAILYFLAAPYGGPMRAPMPTVNAVEPAVKPDPNARLTDLPPGLLRAMRRSGVSFHVESDGLTAALVIRPLSGLNPELRDEVVRFGYVLGAILMGSAPDPAYGQPS